MLCIRYRYAILSIIYKELEKFMFIRRIKRANGQVSVVLVEGYRLDGKVKQRTIEYLGTESVLTKDDPDAINKLIEKYKNEHDKEDAFVKLTINLTEKISEKNAVRNYGYFYLERMYKELGIAEVCSEIQNKTGIKYDLNGCLKLLCFMRALSPSSKKTSLEKGFNHFLEDYDIKLKQIYKSLTLFAENKTRFIAKMHNNLCQNYRRSTDILYYDVTNYFFEIDKEDALRKKGCSKEYRPLPIIQMGLFMDNQGLPVDFYLYEGNKPDCTTLKPSFSEIKSKYNTQKVIITADKGLNSDSNIGYILSENNGYIVSQKIRGAAKDLVAKVLDDQGWEAVDNQDFKLKEFIRTIDVTYPNGSKYKHNQKVICIWSEKYQTKERAIRDNLLEKIIQLVDNPAKFKQSCHKGMKKYINEFTVDSSTGEKTSVKINTELDKEKLANDEILDGYYLLVTSETQLAMGEIIKRYRGLWKIEQSFRITKTDLQGRPVFVRTKEHIEAHFLTCFIALTMLRMLEIKLNHKYSCARIIDGLNSAIATEMAKGIYSINKRDAVMDELDAIYDLEFNNRYVKTEKMREYRSKIVGSDYGSYAQRVK